MKSVHDVATYAVLGTVFLLTVRAWPGDKPAVHIVEASEHQREAEPRVVTVTGSAEMLIPPDEISVNISYREYWRNGEARDKMTIETLENKIVKAAEKAGIPAKSIAIASYGDWKYNWNYWNYWYGTSDALTQKSLTIRLKTTSQLRDIIDNIKARSIQKQGIVGITLSASSHSKIQEYRKLVKTRALQAAQDKAGYLLESLGETRSRLLRVSEAQDPQTATTSTQGHFGYPYYYGLGGLGYRSQTQGNLGISNVSVAVPYAPDMPGNSESTDLTLKPIQLQYAIEATFEIGGAG
jgi:hypothetical protein